MNLSTLTASQVAEAVSKYNNIYGEMDKALWCLSRHCRNSLLEGRDIEVVETLIWTVKSWWGIQGVRTETKTLMAQALARMEWSAELFDETTEISENAVSFAHHRVSALVLELPRREFSLASKTLHWLLPWRIPVYDRSVRQSLGISKDPPNPFSAYRETTQKLFSLARKFEAENPSWMGEIDPKSPLRALDKYLWSLGGTQATVVRKPWKVVYQLGLDCNL